MPGNDGIPGPPGLQVITETFKLFHVIDESYERQWWSQQDWKRQGLLETAMVDCLFQSCCSNRGRIDKERDRRTIRDGGEQRKPRLKNHFCINWQRSQQSPVRMQPWGRCLLSTGKMRDSQSTTREFIVVCVLQRKNWFTLIVHLWIGAMWMSPSCCGIFILSALLYLPPWFHIGWFFVDMTIQRSLFYLKWQSLIWFSPPNLKWNSGTEPVLQAKD